MINKQDVITYLEKKIDCYDMIKVKEANLVIKIFMSEELFDLIIDELTETQEIKKISSSGDLIKTIGFGIYKDCLVWKRFDQGETLLAIMDSMNDHVLTYV